MEFRHLSDKFYKKYPSEQFPELMAKENRPYTQVITDINGLKFAVPLKSKPCLACLSVHKTSVV